MQADCPLCIVIHLGLAPAPAPTDLALVLALVLAFGLTSTDLGHSLPHTDLLLLLYSPLL